MWEIKFANWIWNSVSHTPHSILSHRLCHSRNDLMEMCCELKFTIPCHSRKSGVDFSKERETEQYSTYYKEMAKMANKNHLKCLTNMQIIIDRLTHRSKRESNFCCWGGYPPIIPSLSTVFRVFVWLQLDDGRVWDLSLLSLMGKPRPPFFCNNPFPDWQTHIARASSVQRLVMQINGITTVEYTIAVHTDRHRHKQQLSKLLYCRDDGKLGNWGKKRTMPRKSGKIVEKGPRQWYCVRT